VEPIGGVGVLVGVGVGVHVFIGVITHTCPSVVCNGRYTLGRLGLENIA